MRDIFSSDRNGREQIRNATSTVTTETFSKPTHNMTKAFSNRFFGPRLTFRGSWTKPFRRVFAALFCVSLVGTAAAQSTLTYTDGDLFLGFRSTDGTSDYLVNIGQPDQFVNASAGTTLQVSSTLGTDLAATFGSDWFSRVDPATGKNAVMWAVVGGRQVATSADAANTLYSSNPTRTAWPKLSNTAQALTTSLIGALGNQFSGNQSTANNPQGLIQTAAGSNSYASFQPGGAHSSGISFQTWNPTDEASPLGRLFFNRIVPGSGASTIVGAFTLASNGALSFTAGTNPVAQFLNISTRLKVLTGDANSLFAGFIVTGNAPKKVAIRGLGPSLGQPPFNLPGTLADPTLELHDASVTLVSNDNWTDDPTQAAMLTAAGLAPTNPKESALIATVNPGQYTAILRGKAGTAPEGIAVVEVYDLDQAANSMLANIATRGFTDTGANILIGGIIVGPGSGLPPRVAVRAIGPSLSSFGITNALQDPTIDLKDVNGTSVQTNDDWQSSPRQGEIVAFGLSPTDARESVVIVSLPPGQYTALVQGKAGATGIATVEAYNLQ
jgi:hypothetical protein